MRKPTAEPNRVFFSYINYAYPSFIEGLARTLDIGGTLTQDDIPDIAAARWANMLVRHGIVDSASFRDGRLVGPIRSKSDAEAIRSYWPTIGRYIRDAMGEFEEGRRDNLPSSVKAK